MTEKDFISKSVNKIKTELKHFPNDFISNCECEIIDVPGKNLILTPPLFDSYEIIDNDGNIIFHLNDFYKAKYILYANREKPLKITMPKNSEEIKMAVKSYENYIDNILRNIEKDYKENFPQSRNFAYISNQIFNLLNLIRL
ncbi:MAG: hypothetical protein N2249_00505 [Melioribacter sp.]|nr:hypothetical protein [Melioribacter sp.]